MNVTAGAPKDSTATSAHLIAHACTIAENFGVPVFPVRVEIDQARPGKSRKIPLINGWQNGAAVTNPDAIEKLFTRHPQATHVGLQTGERSRLLVIDLDGESAISWWRANSGLLPPTRTHRTRRPGGKHLLYRMPAGCGLRNSAGKIAPGVDVRANGGFIVDWSSDFQPEGDEIVDAPAELISLLQRASSKPMPALAKQSDDPVIEGRRNDTLIRLGGKLRRDGLEETELEAALSAVNQRRCTPPLPQDEVVAIAKSLARYDSNNSSVALIPIPPRSPLDWPVLQGQTPPARRWALHHWLPQGHPALLPGRGGIGKTLLVQCLGTAMALGRNYIEEISQSTRVLFWAGEDDKDELWRRQVPICNYFGAALADLKDRFFLHSYNGADITLAGLAFGQLVPTDMITELREQINDYRAEYVFLDNVARVYGGNENDRHQATQFLAWLSAACAPAGVCLLAHPAKGAGSEYSGSTAWEGAVRARLYLSDRLPDAESEDEHGPPDERVRYLSRRKSNYSPNDWRRFDLRDGVLVPGQDQFVAVADIGGEFARDIIRRAVRELGELGFHGNASTRSPDYLPKLAKQYGLLEQLNEKRFGAIMRELIKDHELIVAPIGRYANRSLKSGLKLK